MITSDEFKKAVRGHFDFLVTEFGMHEAPTPHRFSDFILRYVTERIEIEVQLEYETFISIALTWDRRAFDGFSIDFLIHEDPGTLEFEKMSEKDSKAIRERLYPDALPFFATCLRRLLPSVFAAPDEWLQRLHRAREEGWAERIREGRMTTSDEGNRGKRKVITTAVLFAAWDSQLPEKRIDTVNEFMGGVDFFARESGWFCVEPEYSEAAKKILNASESRGGFAHRLQHFGRWFTAKYHGSPSQTFDAALIRATNSESEAYELLKFEWRSFLEESRANPGVFCTYEQMFSVKAKSFALPRVFEKILGLRADYQRKEITLVAAFYAGFEFARNHFAPEIVVIPSISEFETWLNQRWRKHGDGLIKWHRLLLASSGLKMEEEAYAGFTNVMDSFHVEWVRKKNPEVLRADEEIMARLTKQSVEYLAKSLETPKVSLPAPKNEQEATLQRQATLIVEEMRLIDIAVDQFSVRENKAARSPVTPRNLTYFLKTTRLHLEASKDQLTDLLGNPITLPGVDLTPQLSEETIAHFSGVVPREFFKPFCPDENSAHHDHK